MAFSNNYSFVDRTLHRLAFATPRLQLDFAEGEDAAFRKEAGAAVRPERPVFITALPRAGTTLLLNIFAELPDFAAHTYRDMPFLLVPLQWNRFSGAFRKADALRERAHGDGVLVGPDSPEAFEEMVWKAMWPDHYRGDRIEPWAAGERTEGFEPFLSTHMLKIVRLRRPGAAARYISKNNVNMARLDWLRRAFPDATLVVPFRDPLQHAASLLRQHRNFLEMHAADPFARDYMAGVGHHDFGANLKPIDFGGWLDAGPADPLGLEFWLRYWVAAYGALLAAPRERLLIVGYDSLCADPARKLAALAALIGVEAPGMTDIRPVGLRPVDTAGIAPALLDEAREIFDRLEAIRALG